MKPQNNLSELFQDIVKIGMDNYIQELLKNDQLKLEMIESTKVSAEVVRGRVVSNLACVGLDDIGLLLELDNDEVVESIVERSGFEAWCDDFLTLCNLIVEEYLQEIEKFNEKCLK
jgi:hypothetical protein